MRVAEIGTGAIRTGLLLALVLAACTSTGAPAASTHAPAASTGETKPSVENEPTPESTPSPTPTEEVAENCMDPEINARLTDEDLLTQPAPPDEAAEIVAALEAYDFSDLPETGQEFVEGSIEYMRQTRLLTQEFFQTLSAGQIPITTCS